MKSLSSSSFKDTHKILATIVAYHVISVAVLISGPQLSWSLVAVIGYLIFSCVINELYHHRYVAHRMFKINPTWGVVLAIACPMSLLGRPVYTAATHVLHHKHSDTELDPHYDRSKLRVWLFLNDNILRNEFSLLRKYSRCQLISWVSRYYFRIHFAWVALALITHPLLAVYGLMIPAVLSFHYNSAVNVVCHRRGVACNSMVLNLFGFMGGSALHGNHHKQPGRMKFSERKWEIDMCYWIAKGLRVHA